jgi:DNA-binding CsgD family transcriptional regulator
VTGTRQRTALDRQTERGDVDAAAASLDRALSETQARLDRAKLLPARVEIALARGETTVAGSATDELDAVASALVVPALEGAAHHTAGTVLAAQGEPVRALSRLRLALRVWRHLGLPYDEAASRLAIARCCRQLGDEATASLELVGAYRILTNLGARPDLHRARASPRGDPGASTHGLTVRELEVLRLLATGLTNRDIADRLSVAVRTVDTHVSHILTKLGVSTRAAATAYAHRHGLT